MSHTLLVIPTGPSVGLTSVTLGLFRALDREGVAVSFVKPVAQPRAGDSGPERSTFMIQATSSIVPPTPIDIKHAAHLLSQARKDELLEEIVAVVNQGSGNAQITIVEGLVPARGQPYAARLNNAIAKALDAEILFVSTPGDSDINALEDEIEIGASFYGGISHSKVLGSIINKVGAPVDSDGNVDQGLINEHPTLHEGLTEDVIRHQSRIFKGDNFKLLGCIPWQKSLMNPRMDDLKKVLPCEVINEGDMTRRVTRLKICARSLNNMIDALHPGSLIITPGDRSDVIVGTCMAALNGVKIAALLLTGGYPPNEKVLALCETAIQSGLPILTTQLDTYQAALSLSHMNVEMPIDDLERVNGMMDFVASHMDVSTLKSLCATHYQRRLSPPAFRYLLVEKARAANKRIVLPEGEEPRTIKAAAICTARRIARCVLLGNPETIQRIAQQNDIALPNDLEILDPHVIRANYVQPMVELRKHKGLNAMMAEAQLEDNVVLGTMMLSQNAVAGLVSGAVHTTANTIRPALQLIKTKPDAALVSSIFFMCLPDQVLVYGDCAVNPDPDAEQLADIAIQSAESAKAFGIEPRVAMISYSTGSSGSGSDVEKVRQATMLAKEKRPDLLIDGPLQYDAALIEKVAQSKAPDSPVAGKATVFVFPDLNTGNTTYKAVQRSADVVSIGPMLQGLKKPVNDLSRGALVEDIVYTIALTAIQASQQDS
jgi:phosphate acetyltransferase